MQKCSESDSVCKTEFFISNGQNLRLSFTSKKKAKLDLIGGEILIKPKRIAKGPEWNVLEYQGLKIGKKYQVVFSKEATLNPKFTFYNNKFERSNLSYIELALIAVAASLFITKSNLTFFNLLLLALCFHLRLDAYFYFDEWTIHNLFSRDDFNLFDYRHNEHYLPAFFLLYLLEAKLFSLNYSFYLIFSCIVHAFNSLLVQKILFKLINKNRISSILSALFLLNSLHSEALHWSFEQSLLICSSLMLLSVFYFIHYLKSQANFLHYWACVLPAFLCPFMFGNGFSLILVLCTFSMLEPKKYLQKLKVIVPISIWYLFSLSFYFGSSSGLGFSIPKILGYLLHTTQYGIVFRGLGFATSLEENIASELITSKYFLNYVIPTALGLITCFFLFCYTYFKKREFLKVFIIGFLIPFATVILPAISRWHFGVEQGLSLRYSYLGILGLSMMLVPVVRKTKIFFLITFCYLFLNFNLISKYRYFSDYGIKHETYVNQLVEWKCKNREITPSYPMTIVPGGGHEFIFRSLKWLEPDICNELSI